MAVIAGGGRNKLLVLFERRQRERSQGVFEEKVKVIDRTRSPLKQKQNDQYTNCGFLSLAYTHLCMLSKYNTDKSGYKMHDLICLLMFNAGSDP